MSSTIGWRSWRMPAHRRRLRLESTGLPPENFGDCKSLRQGLFELRIDWGPGYRVYYAMIGRECVLLLFGGDKRKQSSDIGRALDYLRD